MGRGSTGPAVQDLQLRLTAAEFNTTGDHPGCFADSTEQAVRLFQSDRGLRVDGVCGSDTWSALVEAGYRLGDRLLYRRLPMFRGDDIAELQRRLASLGFDAGRVDGIFGDTTAHALADFQHNAGLPADGICGRETLEELLRVQLRSDQPRLVTAVRERELLRRAPRTLEGRKVALGEHGGFGAAMAALARALRSRGAEVLGLSHPDDSRLAEEANKAGAELYLGLLVEPSQRRCTTYYYAGYRYQSVGGRRLAELVQAALPLALDLEDGGPQGMSFDILRETRMPAVVCEIGPTEVWVRKGPLLATTLSDVLAQWALESWE